MEVGWRKQEEEEEEVGRGKGEVKRVVLGSSGLSQTNRPAIHR